MGLFIPKNATNGDMILSLYKPYRVCIYVGAVHVYMTKKDFTNAYYQINFDSEWWNMPFKGDNVGTCEYDTLETPNSVHLIRKDYPSSILTIVKNLLGELIAP